MYDGLIVQIRQLQHWFKPNESDQFDPYEILEQAANAVEELSRRIDQAVYMYNRGIEKAAMYEVLIGLSPEPPKDGE